MKRFFFQAEDGIRDRSPSRGLGDVYKRQINTSSKELNLYISADYLKMISSVQVAAAINVKLYLMLALVLFFVIGCCGAVLLGRLSDVVDYLLYVDKKLSLIHI